VTATPRRIQRRRTKGWRLPDGAVIVSRPSRFGNPFTIAQAVEAEMGEPRSACAANYAEWLRVGTAGGWYEQTYRIGKQVFDRRRILAELHLLRGKDLACTCPLPEPGQPDHCHGAVLLLAANDYGALPGSGVCDHCWQWDANPAKFRRCPDCGSPWSRTTNQPAA
jgi:hypothetical protein